MLFREKRREGETRGREREILMREKHQLVACCTHPDWGLDVPGPGINLQPGYVP